jgi:hypothetical protein
MLTSVLDRLHEAGGASETASAIALVLTPGDLWQVAVLHLAGLLRQEPISGGAPEPGRVQFESFSVRLQKAAPSDADIEYCDRNIAFHADGVQITNHDGPRMVSDMLRLLQFARDHSDTLCYLPPDMRAWRFEAVASDCGASVAFTRFICARFPSLERTVIG